MALPCVQTTATFLLHAQASNGRRWDIYRLRGRRGHPAVAAVAATSINTVHCLLGTERSVPSDGYCHRWQHMLAREGVGIHLTIIQHLTCSQKVYRYAHIFASASWHSSPSSSGRCTSGDTRRSGPLWCTRVTKKKHFIGSFCASSQINHISSGVRVIVAQDALEVLV